MSLDPDPENKTIEVFKKKYIKKKSECLKSTFWRKVYSFVKKFSSGTIFLTVMPDPNENRIQTQKNCGSGSAAPISSRRGSILGRFRNVKCLPKPWTDTDIFPNIYPN